MDDVGVVFRRMHKMDDDVDIVTFIRQAISVASVISPDQLKNQRSNIIKLLFKDDHHDRDSAAESCPRRPRIVSPPATNNCKNNNNNKPAAVSSRKIKIKIVKKPELAAAAAAVSSRKIIRIKIVKKPELAAAAAFNNTPRQEAGSPLNDDYSNKAAAAANNINLQEKLEATKRKLSQRYAEDAENKAKRKIQCIGLSETKKLLRRDNKLPLDPPPKRMKMMIKKKN